MCDFLILKNTLMQFQAQGLKLIFFCRINVLTPKVLFLQISWSKSNPGDLSSTKKLFQGEKIMFIFYEKKRRADPHSYIEDFFRIEI